MLEYMADEGNVIHFFTDDPQYREKMKSLYEDAFMAGMIQTGPTVYDPKLQPNTSSAEKARFKRYTGTVDAAVEFTCMALCDEFIGTAGSTVTFLVRALNRRYAKPFGKDIIIGKWHVPDRPTMRFRQDCQNIVDKLGDRLKENVGVNITHAQANVLDFLSDHHLQEMHEVLTKHLLENNGTMIGSRLGDVFLRDCQVARMNKDRFKQCEPDRVGNQHWLKALLKGRLRQFSGRSSEIFYHICMCPDASIKLIPKTGAPSHESASSSSAGPSSKKMRFG